MRSITDMVFTGDEKTGEDLEKAQYGPATSADQDGAYLPKSWFTDPFALLDSLGLGYKASPSGLSYDTLKQMAENSVIIAAVIQTRVHQVASFCQPQPNKYSIGFKISHRDPNRKLSEGEINRIKEIEAFVLNCGVDDGADREDFETYIKKSVRDRLVYDQMCTELVCRYNGKPHSFFAVPGKSIRLASPKKRKGTPLTQKEIRKSPKYIQVIDGTIVNTYTPEEMAFSVANPRTDLRAWGYGYSELEMLIKTVTSHLWAEEWNRRAFSQGSTMKGILNVRGNIPPQQMEAFKRQWLTQISGVSNAWRTPIINSNDDLQWISLQPTNQEMGYQEWMHYLVRIVCAIYLIDPAEINFDLRASMGAQPMFMTTNEAQQKMSQDRGLRPLLRHIENHLNRNVIWRLDKNYQYEFVGVDAKSEAEAIELRMKELGSYKTLNEVREADQLPPVEYGDIVPNPSYIGYRNQKEMAEQQQAMMGGMGGEGGVPGFPMGAAQEPGKEEQQAHNKLMSAIGEKPKALPGYKPKMIDRYYRPEEDWEQTYKGVDENDLRKAVEPFDDFIDN